MFAPILLKKKKNQTESYWPTCVWESLKTGISTGVCTLLITTVCRALGEGGGVGGLVGRLKTVNQPHTRKHKMTTLASSCCRPQLTRKRSRASWPTRLQFPMSLTSPLPWKGAHTKHGFYNTDSSYSHIFGFLKGEKKTSLICIFFVLKSCIWMHIFWRMI